ncbi:MAG: PilZ domain-containing protein [Methylococcaceae bacterium]|nr:PilZ domain-containing protein [Methylococcaceae bacterium]
MPTSKVNDKKSNQRVALRVYEQVNLFYQKIALNQLNETQPGFDNILNSFARSQSSAGLAVEPSFPYSQSQENDTLNANISSGGIAFTCKEQMEAGDFLMLRILFLSSMTVVMTCCKVVYCKPSNPYESNRHPYSIGAQFINLTAEDSELLNKHVGKRKKQQFLVNGAIITIPLAILTVPDLALDLLMDVGHHLIEIFLHMLHLVFEYLEMGLDHVIEHLFHTGTHETQVIAFYVLVTFGLIALYYFGRLGSSAFMRLSKRQLLFWTRKKSSCLYFWSHQTLLDKVKIVGIGTSAIVGYIFFGM